MNIRNNIQQIDHLGDVLSEGWIVRKNGTTEVIDGWIRLNYGWWSDPQLTKPTGYYLGQYDFSITSEWWEFDEKTVPSGLATINQDEIILTNRIDDWDNVRPIVKTEVGAHIYAGDANLDRKFDSADLVQMFKGGKIRRTRTKTASNLG